MNDLRPTLFLAQLSNLLAGNIAIVHGVTGSSRTFMGEEAAGVDAARIALARIAAGQSDIALVGAAHNGERKDMLMLYEFGDFNLKDKFAAGLGAREQRGFALGSGGAFLVIESKAHAAGARRQALCAADATWSPISARRKTARRGHGVAATDCGRSSARSSGHGRHHHRRHRRRARDLGRARVPRQASATSPVRATGTPFGHTMEAQFPLGIGLAALAISRGACFRPTIRPASRLKCPTPPTQIVVIGTGHWRGEGMALVEADQLSGYEPTERTHDCNAR